MVKYISMNKKEKNGFIQLIILIIVALFTMKYFGITVSEVINWFLNTFHNVLK